MTLFDLIAAQDAHVEAVTQTHPVAKERARLHAANLRVLAFLQGRGALGATNVEICQPGIGGAEGCKRVRELRAAGYDIPSPTRTPGSGTTRYFLRGIRAL